MVIIMGHHFGIGVVQDIIMVIEVFVMEILVEVVIEVEDFGVESNAFKCL
jgi:hypothetical protein